MRNEQKVTISSSHSFENIHFIHLIWPIFLDQLLKVTLVNADILMLSGYSDKAVAGVSISGQMILVSTFLYGAIGIGTQIMVAQLIGARDYSRVKRTIIASLYCSIVVGAIFSILFLCFSDIILSKFVLSEDLYQYAKTYCIGVGAFSIVMCVQNTITCIVRSYGFVKAAVTIPIVVNILNVFGNYILIYGKLGFPSLGVQGVVISTVISNVIGLIVACYLLWKCIGLRYTDFGMPKKNWSEIKKILMIGIPSSGEAFSYNASMLVITFIVTFIGTAELTTKVYVQNVSQIITIFSLTIGSAAQILIGYLIGARMKGRALKQAIVYLKIGLLFTLIASILLYLFGTPIISFFTDNEEIIQLSKTLLLLTIFLELLRAINIIIVGSLNAAMDVRFPVSVSIVVVWFICLPLAYYLGIYTSLGIIGIWLALIIDEAIRSVLMLRRWKSKKWMLKSLE